MSTRLIRAALCAAALAVATPAAAQSPFPAPVEADFVARDVMYDLGIPGVSYLELIGVDARDWAGGTGDALRGHEFHYSTILTQPDAPLAAVTDATGEAVPETGSTRLQPGGGLSTGTFFHLIAGAT